ncbi:hypothetical protein BUALT_Bualt04G0065700 [Buddleja alternifolia]|uniref:Secreted protein n=1 Tax=Buddleja alternifolia TaxID=168488 RepID=A0AAV6XXF3_9LAMI|nr:hypothetical protein BUALT_Bualt04G0065700 [Buddleja alternifolia]
MVINLATVLAGTVTNLFEIGYFQGPATAPLEAVTHSLHWNIRVGRVPGLPSSSLELAYVRTHVTDAGEIFGGGHHQLLASLSSSGLHHHLSNSITPALHIHTSQLLAALHQRLRRVTHRPLFRLRMLLLRLQEHPAVDELAPLDLLLAHLPRVLLVDHGGCDGGGVAGGFR